jgi:hypothetical protein
VDLTHIALLPVLEHTLGVADHRVAVARQPFGMKARCHQAALALPELAQNATQWQVNYNGGASHEMITFYNGAVIDPGDFIFI